MEDQKLIVDQPDRVTVEGTVESVVAPPKAPKQKLNESSKKGADVPVLLTEQPADDGFIMLAEGE